MLYEVWGQYIAILVLERLGGNLWNATIHARLDQRAGGKLATDMIMALSHLEILHVVHRDVKQHNVCLADDACTTACEDVAFKLIDFDSVCYLDSLERRKSLAGTLA